MALCAKIDEQIDKNYEIVSINKSLSEQNIYRKLLDLLFFIFNVFRIIRRNV